MKTKFSFRILFLSLLTLLGSSVFGQSTPQETSDLPPELTKERVYEDVKSALSQLGESLKVGSEHVYEVLVKNQVVLAYTNIVIYSSIFGLVLLFLVLGIIGRKLEWSEDFNHPMIIVSAIFLVGLLIYFFITIRETISGLTNPEYGAIKEILSVLRR